MGINNFIVIGGFWSFMDPLYVFLSWVIREMHSVINNYGWTIIIFTILSRVVLIPLGIKQYKSTMVQQMLAPQMRDLEARFKDKMELQQAKGALLKEYKASPLGGCLPQIIQLLLIFPIYRIFNAPLIWISQVSLENINKVAQYLLGLGLITEAQAAPKALEAANIPIVQALQSNSSAFFHTIEQGWLNFKDVFDLSFLGINLGDTPSVSPAKLFGPEAVKYWGLLFLVFLTAFSAYLTSVAMERTKPQFKEFKEEKARASKNPAKAAPVDATESTARTMKYMMPVMQAFFALMMPAAMGVYFITTSLMMAIHQYIFHYMFKKNKPSLIEE